MRKAVIGLLRYASPHWQFLAVLDHATANVVIYAQSGDRAHREKNPG